MSVTIKDIAKRAKVSYATVSRALSDQPGINDKTKRKIKVLAQEMGYTPNAVAKGLVTRNTYTLGLMVPDITNPFFPEVAQGIEESANLNGYQVFLCNTNWDLSKEKEYLKKLYSSRVDGIVVGPSSDEISHIIEMDLNIPFVFAAYRPKVKNCSYVVIDDFKGAVIAVEYLVKIGHRKIAFIGGQQMGSTNMDRFDGYKTALEKNEIPFNINYVIHGQYRQSSGYNLARKMLLTKDKPTAILAGNDIIALGVIQAIEESGLRVPEDISVIGFDDISYASLDKIQLTTIYQPKYDIGKICIEILLGRIKNPDNSNTQSRILEPKLIIRKTCMEI